MRFLLRLLINAAALWIATRIVPGVSHTGSGIKTILLVLVFLYLVPRIERRTLADYVFGFEELENNLHPALQRRDGVVSRRLTGLDPASPEFARACAEQLGRLVRRLPPSANDA